MCSEGPAFKAFGSSHPPPLHDDAVWHACSVSAVPIHCDATTCTYVAKYPYAHTVKAIRVQPTSTNSTGRRLRQSPNPYADYLPGATGCANNFGTWTAGACSAQGSCSFSQGGG